MLFPTYLNLFIHLSLCYNNQRKQWPEINIIFHEEKGAMESVGDLEGDWEMQRGVGTDLGMLERQNAEDSCPSYEIKATLHEINGGCLRHT